MKTKFPSCTPEMWGGIECTINRVGNIYRDQSAETGHDLRDDDIAQIAATGVCKLRYPVLWEKHLPDINGNIDWSLTRLRLNNLRFKNITPIAGLLHHGSGPMHTELLDEDFPEKLAKFAKSVAAEFPWLKYYTPVNEPLTTARFSGLYGFWYPHLMDERSFILMLLNQVKGIILSMQAIRTINPAALLVQTEDLCKVHSVSSLAYQAAFENQRRWLTYDLLCGNFTPKHPLWHHFLSLNIPEVTLSFFYESPCPPDIMGFNYYITSERYLDDDLTKYPAEQHGGNFYHRYVDTDAARSNHRLGLAPLMEEAWERYHLPMAVTECHLNCSREEQMRWLQETWDACILLNNKGIPVKAITAWSLLGSFDWDSLLLQSNRHYESGVFDVSSGNLRPTILTELIQAFATGDSYYHPLLANQGWWHGPTVDKTNKIGTIDPLVLLYPAKISPVLFEELCKERRINQLAISFETVLLQNEAYLLQSLSSLRSWGLIILLPDNDNNAEDLSMCEHIIKQCKDKQLPLMIYLSQSASALLDQLVLIDNEYCLIAQTENIDDMNLAQQALDLFIDAQKGVWTINEHGVRKLVIKEPLLFY